MRVLIGALLLSLGAWQTHHRAQEWRSDQALWTAARRTAPNLERPAFNLGMALMKAGAWNQAATELVTSTRLYSPHQATYLEPKVRQVLELIDASMGPVCQRPDVRPWCA